MTAHLAGSTVADVLSIDYDDVDPLGSRTISMPRRFSALEPADGAVYDAYRSRIATAAPRIVNRRYRSGNRTARAVWTYFSDEFTLVLSDAVWGTSYREVVGNDSEWYCLSLRLTGDTVETINGRDHLLGAYSCYLVRYAPGMRHVLRSVSEQPMAEACITFRPRMLAEKLGWSREELLRRLHPDRDAWYSDCRMTPEMEKIIRGLRSRSPTDPEYRLVAEAKALELLSMYVAGVQEQSRGRRRWTASSDALSRLHRVRRHLEENYDRDPAIDELSAMAGLGRKRLTTDFKREFGKTLHEYHQSVRMEIAKALLRSDDVSVIDVAQRVGYGYPANFAKAFRKHAGVSPRSYRRSHARELL